MRRAPLAFVLLSGSCACAPPRVPAPPPAFAPEPFVVAGSFEADRQPDGNSVVFDAPDGLVVVDTGRHPEHVEALVARARAAGKPIAAIVNTHWHLDHTGGNAELRAAYPHAEIVATTAVEGALTGFFPASRAGAEELLASGQAPPGVAADIHLDIDAMDHPEALRPTRAVSASGPITLAGRRFEAHVAPFAATAADLWLYDPASRTLVAGDLVVAPVPFFDTACARGWRAALAELAAVPFERLVPGHGEPMTRARFDAWRAAFDALVDCAGSSRGEDECVAGWISGAAGFFAPDDRPRLSDMLRYYLRTNLREPAAAARFCATPRS